MHRGGQSGATTQIQEGEEKAALCCARRHQTSVTFLFCCRRHVCKSQLLISKPHPTSGAAPASSCIPRRFPSRGEVTGPVAWNKQGTRCLRLHWPAVGSEGAHWECYLPGCRREQNGIFKLLALHPCRVPTNRRGTIATHSMAHAHPHIR